MALRQPGNTTQGPATKPNNVVGVKSMSGPDSSGDPPKGALKRKIGRRSRFFHRKEGGEARAADQCGQRGSQDCVHKLADR